MRIDTRVGADWDNRASATVQGFVARRLRGRRVGFLPAARSESANLFDRGGLSEFELAPAGRGLGESADRCPHRERQDRMIGCPISW
jgi:hypothetical protein